MKLELLGIIYIIIILPITIVFNSYIENLVSIAEIEGSYDERLLASSQDAAKAFQINTINNGVSNISNSKISDIEATVSTFFSVLSTNFGYTGYRSSVMEEYVPAVVFALYDGYYIYSPFVNTLTTIQDSDGNPVLDTSSANPDVDLEDYPNNGTMDGLKSYVYYSCRYQNGADYDFIITYTLDNYITIEGIIDGNYEYRYGYLMDGITQSGSNYIYDGITFRESDTEALKEFVGDTEYYYATINGTNYYYSGTSTSESGIGADDYIFYINQSGQITKQVNSYSNNEENFLRYYRAIMQNKSSYLYYKEAYEFTHWVRDNLSDAGFNTSWAVNTDAEYIPGNIFADTTSSGVYIQDSNSTFYQHRAEVIRYVIETNLSTAISGFSNYGNEDITYIMPIIDDIDWDLLVNNVCIVTFMQGMPLGTKTYNNYSVVPITLTKEYVDENDIYILTNDRNYTKVTDNLLLTGEVTIQGKTTSNNYYAGILDLSFERHIYYEQEESSGEDTSMYYYPKSYSVSYTDGSGNTLTRQTPYLGSYTSIILNTTVNSLENSDMYRYLRGLTSNANATTLKGVYYKALGRERYGSYKSNNDLSLEYYLEEY